MVRVGEVVRVKSDYAGAYTNIRGQLVTVETVGPDGQFATKEKYGDNYYSQKPAVVLPGEYEVPEYDVKDKVGTPITVGCKVAVAPAVQGARLVVGEVAGLKEYNSYGMRTSVKVLVATDTQYVREESYGSDSRRFKIPGKVYRWYSHPSGMLVLQVPPREDNVRPINPTAPYLSPTTGRGVVYAMNVNPSSNGYTPVDR